MGADHGRGKRGEKKRREIFFPFCCLLFFRAEKTFQQKTNSFFSSSLFPLFPPKTSKNHLLQGTGFAAQVYELSTQFLPKEWIMEKWEDGFYITAMAGAASGASLVVMSKGTPYTQQSYKVSDSFPFKWINKKWKEGFYVTSMATSHTR